MLKPDDIISFSNQLLYGFQQPWGKSWTQTEIEGFFYNDYLNTPLQNALKEARTAHLGCEEPPCQYRWDGKHARRV